MMAELADAAVIRLLQRRNREKKTKENKTKKKTRIMKILF
jgi:hypothetical protein